MTMASRISNNQSFQFTGSTVSIGSIEQKNLAAPEDFETAEAAEVPPKVRILFTAANPGGTSRLRLDREIKAIGEALRAGASRDLFDLDQAWAASSADLQDHLLRYKPHVVHLSGHGEEGALILERAFGGGSSVEQHAASSQGLAELFSRARNDIRCVVLNACSSAPLAEKIAESIDCAIGMSEPVDDSLAILFSWSFYNALGNGQSVAGAFHLACAQAGLYEGGAGHTPRLFARRIDSASLYFFDESSGRSGASETR
jgi:hypothetical protein